MYHISIWTLPFYLLRLVPEASFGPPVVYFRYFREYLQVTVKENMGQIWQLLCTFVTIKIT